MDTHVPDVPTLRVQTAGLPVATQPHMVLPSQKWDISVGRARAHPTVGQLHHRDAANARVCTE